MLDSIAYVINAIWGVFTSIGLNDIVDIAILSFLIFHGIKLIRETRAQQLTKGILILIGCYLLAVFFNLQTIRFLLRICFQWGFLALIIMFQPDVFLKRLDEQVWVALISLAQVTLTTTPNIGKKLLTLYVILPQVFLPPKQVRL